MSVLIPRSSLAWTLAGCLFAGCGPAGGVGAARPAAAEAEPDDLSRTSRSGTDPETVNSKPSDRGTPRDGAGNQADVGHRGRLPGLGQAAPSPASTVDDLLPEPGDWFEDVTSRTGIEATYRNGREAQRYFILESLGGGVGMIDFDLDGDLDLVFAGGGTFSRDEPCVIKGLPASLYRNDGEWSFANRTAQCGLDLPADYSHGFTVVDYDADGFPDLHLSCYRLSRLYRNQGDGTFLEAVHEADFPATGWGTSAAWGDLDSDGHPDLFLGLYLDWDPARELVCRDQFGQRDVCGPAQYPGTVGKFLHNEGDGTFADWSSRVGLVGGVKGLGAVACDFDGDGWLDFYAANDETPNQLYLGRPGGLFEEVGKTNGVAFNEYGVEEGSMGLGVDDVDGDGRPDIWVTNFENEDNALYRNLGQGQFRHSSFAFGVAGHSRAMVGFGTVMLDLDSDTWPDLFVCNGNAVYSPGKSPYRQKPQLFRNLAGRRFENVSTAGGTYFRTDHAGRGLAVGDLDQDGAVDAVIVHQNDRAVVLRNLRGPRNWVRVVLRGTRGVADAVGSVVTLRTGPREVVRPIVQGTGYFSQCDLAVVFALPEECSSARVSVNWLGRGSETFDGLTPRQTQILIEGRGQHD